MIIKGNYILSPNKARPVMFVECEPTTCEFYCDYDEAKFIVEACNACKEINPDNPMLVAQNIKGLLEAVERFLESSACSNGCKPDDMTCDTQFARAVLSQIKGGE